MIMTQLTNLPREFLDNDNNNNSQITEKALVRKYL